MKSIEKELLNQLLDGEQIYIDKVINNTCEISGPKFLCSYTKEDIASINNIPTYIFTKLAENNENETFNIDMNKPNKCFNKCKTCEFKNCIFLKAYEKIKKETNLISDEEIEHIVNIFSEIGDIISDQTRNSIIDYVINYRLLKNHANQIIFMTSQNKVGASIISQNIANNLDKNINSYYKVRAIEFLYAEDFSNLDRISYITDFASLEHCYLDNVTDAYSDFFKKLYQFKGEEDNKVIFLDIDTELGNSILAEKCDLKNMIYTLFDLSVGVAPFSNQYLLNILKNTYKVPGFPRIENENVESDILAEMEKIKSSKKLRNEDLMNEILNKLVFDDNYTITGIQKESEENIENTYIKKLNKLVGLTTVKDEILKLEAYLQYLNKVEGTVNLNKNINLNCAFLGNPGTGKTTVARIYTEMLYELGYIKENKLIEVTRNGLIDKYVGGTAIKTQNVINKAKGGVLFIDEAYSLTSNSKQDFADEAIAVLVKEMENNDNLVVIFAGYTDKTKEFLKSNDGLLSRISNIIEFPNYSKKELLEIFKNQIEDANLKVDVEAEPLILENIKIATQDKTFGNARYINNFKQKIIKNHALNTKNKYDFDSLLTITKDDIPKEKNLEKDKVIGFR